MSTEKAPLSSNTFPERLNAVFRHFYGKEWGGQRKLSRLTGIASGTISEWFKEESPTTPDNRSISRISEKLGISFEWLATGKGEMLPKDSAVAPGGPRPADAGIWMKAVEDLTEALKARGLSNGATEDQKKLMVQLLVQGQQAGTPPEELRRQLDQLVDLLEASIRRHKAG